MSTRETARDAIVSQAKKAGDVSRYQIHVYLGANDYFYEQLRRSAGRVDVATVQDKLGQLTDEGVEPLRRVIKSASPAKLREAVQEQVETVRGRREEFAHRGETIAADWSSALAVKDASSLIETVRGADGAGDLAKSLKTWLAEFPPAQAPARTASTATARKTTARKATARKTARKSTARKTTARKTAATKPAASTTE